MSSSRRLSHSETVVHERERAQSGGSPAPQAIAVWRWTLSPRGDVVSGDRHRCGGPPGQTPRQPGAKAAMSRESRADWWRADPLTVFWRLHPAAAAVAAKFGFPNASANCGQCQTGRPELSSAVSTATRYQDRLRWIVRAWLLVITRATIACAVGPVNEARPRAFRRAGTERVYIALRRDLALPHRLLGAHVVRCLATCRSRSSGCPHRRLTASAMPKSATGPAPRAAGCSRA